MVSNLVFGPKTFTTNRDSIQPYQGSGLRMSLAKLTITSHYIPEAQPLDNLSYKTKYNRIVTTHLSNEKKPEI